MKITVNSVSKDINNIFKLTPENENIVEWSPLLYGSIDVNDHEGKKKYTFGESIKNFLDINITSVIKSLPNKENYNTFVEKVDKLINTDIKNLQSKDLKSLLSSLKDNEVEFNSESYKRIEDSFNDLFNILQDLEEKIEKIKIFDYKNELVRIVNDDNILPSSINITSLDSKKFKIDNYKDIVTNYILKDKEDKTYNITFTTKNVVFTNTTDERSYSFKDFETYMKNAKTHDDKNNIIKKLNNVMDYFEKRFIYLEEFINYIKKLKITAEKNNEKLYLYKKNSFLKKIQDKVKEIEDKVKEINENNEVTIKKTQDKKEIEKKIVIVVLMLILVLKVGVILFYKL